MEDPHYWLSVENQGVSSIEHARHSMAEDSAEVVVREYFTDSLKLAFIDYLECWSYKAVICLISVV